jgi:hypothetical protein
MLIAEQSRQRGHCLFGSKFANPLASLRFPEFP